MKILKIIVTVILSITFLVIAAGPLAKVADRNEPLRRYRDVPVAPRVHLRAIVHKDADSKVPPLCLVTRQHYGSCGKSSCWKYVSSIITTTGTLEPTWSSSPVPKSLEATSAWKAEPSLDSTVVERSDGKAIWALRAKKIDVDFEPLGPDRLLEDCVADGDTIYAVGCVTGNELDACPGDKTWNFVPADTPKPAIREATNDMARILALAFGLLFVVPLIWVPKRGALVDVLATRSGHPARSMSWAYLLLVIFPVGLFFNFLFRTSYGGFVLFVTVLVGYGLLAGNLLMRRRRVLDALEPVLRTERSPIASASGTAELVVKARMTEPGVSPILAPDPVAYARTVVTELYQVGKNQGRIVRATLEPVTKIEVFDESGEGILDLSNAVLDVRERVVTYTAGPPPRLAAMGIELERHANHTSYHVTEKRIDDGASLYVFGDVSELRFRPDGGSGYRAVQGSPTLGGAGHPPLLVYQGDEAGLVASLRRESRVDSRVAFLASCLTGLASAIAAFLLTR